MKGRVMVQKRMALETSEVEQVLVQKKSEKGIPLEWKAEG